MSLTYKMIRRCASTALVGLTFVLQPESAAAADRPRLITAFFCPTADIAFIGELMPPIVTVLEDEKVRAELGLTNDQIEKLREIEKTYDAGVKGVLSGSDEKSRELMQGSGKNEEHVLAIGKMSEESRKKTNELLKKKQLLRMQEIMLQLYGVLFIPKKDLRQMLELDQKQERAIDEIKARIFRKIDETTTPDLVTVAANRCKFATHVKPDLADLLTESEQAVYRLLGPEQKNVIEKLKGAPFIL